MRIKIVFDPLIVRTHFSLKEGDDSEVLFLDGTQNVVRVRWVAVLDGRSEINVTVVRMDGDCELTTFKNDQVMRGSWVVVSNEEIVNVKAVSNTVLILLKDDDCSQEKVVVENGYESVKVKDLLDERVRKVIKESYFYLVVIVDRVLVHFVKIICTDEEL